MSLLLVFLWVYFCGFQVVHDWISKTRIKAISRPFSHDCFGSNHHQRKDQFKELTENKHVQMVGHQLDDFSKSLH